MALKSKKLYTHFIGAKSTITYSDIHSKDGGVHGYVGLIMHSPKSVIRVKFSVGRGGKRREVADILMCTLCEWQG